MPMAKQNCIRPMIIVLLRLVSLNIVIYLNYFVILIFNWIMSLRHFNYSLKLRTFYNFVIVINKLNVNQGYKQCYNNIKLNEIKKFDKL